MIMTDEWWMIQASSTAVQSGALQTPSIETYRSLNINYIVVWRKPLIRRNADRTYSEFCWWLAAAVELVSSWWRTSSGFPSPRHTPTLCHTPFCTVLRRTTDFTAFIRNNCVNACYVYGNCDSNRGASDPEILDPAGSSDIGSGRIRIRTGSWNVSGSGSGQIWILAGFSVYGSGSTKYTGYPAGSEYWSGTPL